MRVFFKQGSDLHGKSREVIDEQINITVFCSGCTPCYHTEIARLKNLFCYPVFKIMTEVQYIIFASTILEDYVKSLCTETVGMIKQFG